MVPISDMWFMLCSCFCNKLEYVWDGGGGMSEVTDLVSGGGAVDGDAHLVVDPVSKAAVFLWKEKKQYSVHFFV